MMGDLQGRGVTAVQEPGSPPEHRADALEGLLLFAGMNSADRTALLRTAAVSRFEKGETIPGEKAHDALMVLCSGAAALGIDNDGRRAVLAVVCAPRVLNLASIVAGARPVALWRATQRSTVLSLPRAPFLQLLARDPRLAGNAASALALDYQDTVAAAAGQRLRCAQERLADYLLSLPPGRIDGVALRLPHSKHLLASLLGMTPENLSRTMAGLARFGVTVRGAEVHIADRERLRDAVGWLGAGSGPRSGTQQPDLQQDDWSS